eukprot:scaffold125348_cov35-Tisochrysis_lutea.AAC.2
MRASRLAPCSCLTALQYCGGSGYRVHTTDTCVHIAQPEYKHEGAHAEIKSSEIEVTKNRGNGRRITQEDGEYHQTSCFLQRWYTERVRS